MGVTTRSQKQALAKRRGPKAPLSHRSTNTISPPPRPRRSARIKALAASANAAARPVKANPVPDLPIEMIGLAASFASTGDDITNICVACGPTSTTAQIRFEYLYDNDNYALNTLSSYIQSDRGVLEKTKCRSRMMDWLNINISCVASWLTGEVIDTHSIAKYVNEEGQVRIRFITVQPFVNPAVAIELGIVGILRALVETQAIDVNAFNWTGYNHYDRYHLLFLAMLERDSSCFEYLMSVSTIDVNSYVRVGDGDDDEKRLIHAAVQNEKISPRHLEALVQHPTCNPNSSRGGGILPLHYSALAAYEGAVKPHLIIEKTRILLRAGADPTLTIGESPPPIQTARNLLRSLDRREKKSERGQTIKKVLHTMEDWVEAREE